MSALNSMSLRPEARFDEVRAQLRESIRILTWLEERRDASDEAFELELRLQIVWLSNAANEWRKACVERAKLLAAKEIYLKREGAAQ